MQYILTGVIVLIFSGLVIHGLTLLLERGALKPLKRQGRLLTLNAAPSF
jgi:hypothetical protein